MIMARVKNEVTGEQYEIQAEEWGGEKKGSVKHLDVPLGFKPYKECGLAVYIMTDSGAWKRNNSILPHQKDFEVTLLGVEEIS